MSLINCKSCAKEMSKDAVACPYCGDPNKKKMGRLAKIGLYYVAFSLAMLTVGVIGSIIAYCYSQTKAGSAPPPAATAVHAPRAVAASAPVVSAPVENDQLEFEAKRMAFAKAYKQGKNEVVKSGVYNDANKWAADWVDQHNALMSGWVGTITTISTPKGGGDVTVHVRSAHNSDIDYVGEDIKRGSTVYADITNLSEGQNVTFDFVFVRDEEIGLKEDSWTESGRIGSPSFIVVFKRILPLTQE